MKKSLLFALIFFTSNLFAQFKSQLSLETNLKINRQDILSFNHKEKSKTLAFFLSLAVPGAGEYYVERFDVGKYFLLTEGGLWLTLWGFDYYGKFQRENYINFAKTNGGVNPSGKDERYWAVIGNYMNINDYNNEKLLNREFNSVYDEAYYYWNWNTNQERKRYRNLWLSSESAFNNKQFPIALIVINHIVSAINAAILANRFNEKLANGSFQLIPNLGVDKFYNPQIYLTFHRSF
ncbi:MAG: hypothetical protein HPY57_09550 [Ignavibacteria bacterium]|nr:hypothetical protein [Ignavibacteria bacterium]